MTEITSNRLEIQPMPQRSGGGSFLARRPQSISYNLDSISGCSVKCAKKGKVELQLTCKGENSFKTYILESDTNTAKNLMEQCQKIIELRTSSIHCEPWREKKPFRRHNSLSMRRKPRTGNHSYEV